MDYCKCAQDEISDPQVTDGSVICRGCHREKKMLDNTAGAGEPVSDAPATPDEREVYLALRGSKTFANRSTDDLPDIRRLIVKKGKSVKVRALLKQYGMEAVLACAEKIYHSGAFTTLETAEELYPDIFPADPDDVAAIKKPEEPVYLNPMALGRLLTTIQSALEHACYEFVARELPETIVPAARGRFQVAGRGPMLTFVQSRSIQLRMRRTLNLDEILESIGRIAKYESATETDATGVLQMLQEANRLIGLLGVNCGHEATQALQKNVEPRIGEFVAEKRRYADQIRERKAHFEAERMKLEKLEKEAVGGLGKEESKFEREATFGLIHEIRSAEDLLFEECFGDKFRMLSLD